MREKYSGPVFNEQIFQGIWNTNPALNREMLEAACSPGVPKSTLADCLSLYTREHLKDLADDFLIPISSATKKNQIVERLVDQLIKDFPVLLPYLPAPNIDFFWQMKGAGKIGVAKDELHYRDISHSQNYGFLFLFNTGTTFTAVIPQELLPSLEGVDSSVMKTNAELHQRLNAYAVSLSNLYGVLDIDQFATIWNRFEAEVITPAEVGDELAMLSRVQYYYWYENELIISSYFMTAEEVMDFLAKVKDIPYYKPSQEEIVTYFQSSYDDRSPAANAMLEFLSGYKLGNGEDLEDLMAEISDVCVAEEDMQEVFDLLDEYGLLFKGLDELTRFTQLFTELSNHSRKWTLRGHTPLAMEKQNSRR
jgi:hypothetical protein